MQLYVTGHVITETEEGIIWDILGIFDEEYKAVDACYDICCFVGPMTLNASFPREIIEWPGCWYPMSQKGES